MKDSFKTRDQAYLDVFHRGLVLLRNLAYAGQIELCQIEADHLHNIPALLGEANEVRHVYYVQGERRVYLQRLRELGAADYLQRVTPLYDEPWRVLASVADVPLKESAAEEEPC